MECKITITGSFAEIQQALYMLTNGAHIDFTEECFNPLCHPHEPIPLDLKREETKSNGAVLNPEISFSRCQENDTAPLPAMERIEKVNKRGRKKKVVVQLEKPQEPKAAGEIHCHTCGTLFVPKRPSVKHCSKRCYMMEWREKNTPAKVPADAKKVAPDAKNVAPDAKNFTPGAMEPKEDIDPVKEKLNHISKTCPAPKPRPNFQRDLIS